MFENPRRGRQARSFATNVPKILDLKSSSEQIFSENGRWVPLILNKYTQHQDVNRFSVVFIRMATTPLYSSKIQKFSS